ncbi:Zn2/Cys6 DNA-binding protein [Apiospora saccharicola]
MAHRKGNSSSRLQPVPPRGQTDHDLQSSEDEAPGRARSNEKSEEAIPRSLRGLSLLDILNCGQGREDARTFSGWGLGVDPSKPPNASFAHQSGSKTEVFACPFLQHSRSKYGTWEGCRQPYQTLASSTLHIRTCKSKIERGGISCFRQDDGNRFEKSMVTAETLVEISKIEKQTNTGSRSVAQRWMHIFGIIFPEEHPPSPYFDFNADEGPSYVLSGMPTSKQGKLFSHTSHPEEMGQQQSVISTKICMPKSGSPTAARSLHRERFNSETLPRLRVLLKLYREAIQNTVAFIRRHAQSEDTDTKGKSTDLNGPASQSLKRKGVHHTGSANGNHGQSPNDNKGSDTDEDDDSRPPKAPRAEAPSTSEDPRELLACPFYQHCPERYQVKNCVGPGWRLVSKVNPEGMDAETQARTELYKILFPKEKIPVPYYTRCAPTFQDTDNDACNADLLLSMAEIVDTQLQDKVFETSSRSLSSDIFTVQESQAIVKNAYNAIVKPFADTISADHMPDLDTMLAEAWVSPNAINNPQSTDSTRSSNTMTNNACLSREWDTIGYPPDVGSTMLERPVGKSPSEWWIDVAF